MRRLCVLLALLISSNANAGAWTRHALGTLGFSDNAAPSMPTFSTGDVLVMVSIAQTDGVARTASLSGGSTFTSIFSDETGATVDVHVWCRVATGGDTAPTIDWTASDNSVYSFIISYSGPTAPNCSTILHASGGTNTNSASWPTAAVTISNTNTLVLSLSDKQNSGGTNYGTVTCPSDINDDASGTYRNITSGAFDAELMICQRIETTAVSTSGTAHGVSGTQSNSNYGSWVVSLLDQNASTPTYSVSPAIGTRTTSTIPFTQTTACTDCTAYGVAETSGLGAPTCTQIKAGQGADGNAAYKSANGAATANTQLTLTFSSYTDGTVRDGYFCLHSTANGDSAVSSIASMYKLPAFSTALTIASTSNTVYTTNSKLLDGAGSVYLVGCKLGAAAPSVSQVEAQTGGCILFSSSDDASGTMTLTATTSPAAYPAYDLYYVGTYGSQHEAAVHTLSGQCLSAPSGRQYINCPTGLTSVTAGAAIDLLNALVSPDWAVGDIPSCDVYTHPSPSNSTHEFKFALTAAGVASYSDGTAGGGDGIVVDGRRTYANCDAYDLSVGAYMTTGNANNDLDWWNNDPAIVCSAPFNAILQLNEAMTAIDLTTKCVHPLGDTLSFAITSGTLPTGVTQSGSTVSGTPTVANADGEVITDTATSTLTGETQTQNFTVFVLDTVDAVDCVSTPTLATHCASRMLSSSLSQVLVAATYTCTSAVENGFVISQSPDPGTQMMAGDTFSMLVSLGATCAKVTVPRCLSKTVGVCRGEVVAASSFASLTEGAGCTSDSSVIYSQTPAANTKQSFDFSMLVYCH